MKFYHFGIAFCVFSMGIFFLSQMSLITTVTREEIKRTEYECLVSAVNAAIDVVFDGERSIVTEGSLKQAEDVFFQTLSVLHDGVSESLESFKWREYVPCLVVFDENGYYRFGKTSESDYGWSERKAYENGEIPNSFFEETKKILSEYHNGHNFSFGSYHMEAAEEGIWERSLTKACVFAVFAPPIPERLTKTEGIYLCAATGREKQAYYVTEDNYCHMPFCPRCKEVQVIAWYKSQKESAMDGAMPCEICLK